MVQTCTYISRKWYTCMCMFIHLWKRINASVSGMYMVCTFRAINMCVHRSNLYLHVNTSIYTQCHCTYNVQTCTCTVCVADVLYADGYINFMKCTIIADLCMFTDISFWLQLFHSPCQLACRLGLAAAWCLAYSSSSKLFNGHQP